MKIYTVNIDNCNMLLFSTFEKALNYVESKGFKVIDKNTIEYMNCLESQNEKMSFCEEMPEEFAMMFTEKYTHAYIGTLAVYA